MGEIAARPICEHYPNEDVWQREGKTFFRITLTAAVVGCQQHEITLSRNCTVPGREVFPGRTNSFACVHPLDKGRNDISKRERKVERVDTIG